MHDVSGDLQKLIILPQRLGTDVAAGMRKMREDSGNAQTASILQSIQHLCDIAAAYAERSPDGPEHFDAVASKSFAMFASEPALSVEDLAAIAAPTLVVSGDDDLPTLDHTVSLYESLPAGQLAVVPAASHAVVLEKPAQITALILEFLAEQLPPRTLMPHRRRPSAVAPGPAE